MDGLKAKIANSLQYKLSAWLALTIFVIALAAGIFSFLSALRDAIELQDDLLRQMAGLINRQYLPAIPSIPHPKSRRGDAESQVVVHFLQPTNSVTPEAGGELAGLPPDLSDGFHTRGYNTFPGASSYRPWIQVPVSLSLSASPRARISPAPVHFARSCPS